MLCRLPWIKTTVAARTAMPSPTTTGDALPFTWIKTTVAARTAMPSPTTTGDALPFTLDKDYSSHKTSDTQPYKRMIAMF